MLRYLQKIRIAQKIYNTNSNKKRSDQQSLVHTHERPRTNYVPLTISVEEDDYILHF